MTPDSFENHLLNWLMRKTGSGAVRRVADLPMAVASNVGLIRADNQDRAAVLRFSEQVGQQCVLFVVCDGMGGMADGALCAATALSSFSASFMRSSVHLPAKTRLSQAALDANNSVYKLYRGSGGSTLSAVLVESNGPTYWVNIGDSRIYQIENQRLKQITIDDTLAGQLSREPSSYEGRSELLQFVGSGPMAEPHVGNFEITPAESLFLITTDGVHYLPMNVMQGLLIHAPDSITATRRLMDLATWFGGHDNATLAIASPSKLFSGDRPKFKTDAVEVWDAFGELRFLNTKFENLAPTVTLSEKLPTSSDDPPITDNIASSGEEKRLVKVKRYVRKKGGTKERPSNPPLTEPPQLKINFPKKEESE